jgi:transposase-like protein
MSNSESVQSHEERRAGWRALVDQARESGQRPSRFCQEHGLDLAKFYYWRRVFALEHSEGSPEAHFALVRRSVAAKEVGGDAGLELQVNRGWRLRIRRGADEATLRMVLGALSKSA